MILLLRSFSVRNGKCWISFTTRDIYGCGLIHREHISENVEVMIHIFLFVDMLLYLCCCVL